MPKDRIIRTITSSILIAGIPGKKLKEGVSIRLIIKIFKIDMLNLEDLYRVVSTGVI